MTSGLDIYRSANVLVKQHGQDAPTHAARADHGRVRMPIVLSFVGDWKETSGEFRFKQSPVQTKNVLIELFRKGVFSMDISQIISAKALGAAVLATIVAPIAALPAHAAENRPCTTTVTRHLDGLGIDRSDVTNIFMITIPQWRGHEREDNELQAWASFRSCPGNLVVKLTTVCRVKEEYTRGGCRFDGVSHF